NMNPVVAKQVALDDALVAPTKRLKIERCNARIESLMKSLKSTCINSGTPSIRSEILMLTTSSWTRKSVELTLKLRESRAQILWGMFNQKNVDYVSLLWEDFMYQADNREISSARKKHMPYPRFTKVIINHFISKDKSISMRNIINLHTVRDDPLLGTLKFMSKTEDSQKYGALIPDGMINQNKARKFKKIASPSRTLSPIKEVEPAKKTKRAKRPAKMSTTAPAAGVIIRDTLALLEAAHVKEALKKSKKDSHMLHTSSSGDGVGSQPKVPDESEDKTTSTDEGTSGDSQDDESNDDDSDDDNDADKVDESKDDDGDSDADDNYRTDSDDDENPSFNLKDDEEEQKEEEYVHTLEYDEFYDEEEEHVNEEEYEDLYGDVNITPKDTKPEKERKGDAKMTDVGLENVSQEQYYEQEVDDAHVSITQKTNIDTEVASLINVKTHQEDSSTQAPPLLTVPVASSIAATSTPLSILSVTPIPQQLTTTPAPTAEPIAPTLPALPDFSSMFGLNQRVSTLEHEMTQVKQSDHSTQILESLKQQIPAIVDELLSTRIGFATQTALQSYTAEFEKKLLEEQDRYFDVIEKSIKGIIKDEVQSQLPQILSKEVSDFATLVIQKTIAESLENVVFIKSSSQPTSSYEAAESLTEFELKKILLDKIEKNSKMPKDQGGDMGNTKDQTNDQAASKQDWFKKPERPPSPDPE
ncbi:hypothetical protein Tco_0703731, partial [Tanacetum coccineum]